MQLSIKRDFGLYVVLDREICRDRDIVRIAAQIIRGKPEVIQLRDKKSSVREIIRTGKSIKRLIKENEVIFIINDRPDIALACDADGVHLGQDDGPVKVARSILGKDKIVGVSCHNISQAIKAEKEGASYIGIGPIFPTETKPHLPPVGLRLIKKIKKMTAIPFVVIGGINQVNIRKVLGRGAQMVAICRAILCTKDVYLAVKQFHSILQDAELRVLQCGFTRIY